jgi:hypothetical protein
MNFTFLPQGLHDTPDLLRKELQQSIDSVGEDYDAILLGYGLWGNYFYFPRLTCRQG